MSWFTKTVVGVVLGILGALSGANADTYPNRPIKLVAPFPPGGGTDIMARALAEQLAAELKQPVIVENRSGASGNIGAAAVARAKNDGYTLLMTSAPFAIGPAIFKDLSFDPIKDFTAITQISMVPLLVVTRADSPLNSIADLIAAAKENDKSISFATFGVGSPPHLTGEKIQELAGIKMLHIPYKGGSEAITELMSGQVSIGILDVISMMPMVKEGRLKALAITGPVRAQTLAEVPTLVEAGVPYDDVGWFGLFAPAGLSPAITNTLNAAVNKILATPDIRRLIFASGTVPIAPPTSPAEWQAIFNENVRVWGATATEVMKKEP
ncbi:tripartite tricarboxylate transporter substrate binding protein [Allopusillimonas ginsengisoli]|uniref:tripartite tricarboxylate transporter substrate binding protein n=1 Tax=Allopusillimonas ginsengisoli TaxID=453575 RepID=UPI00102256E7|nr:tripartite tricarboxylate transporter substrate binding protein [Allopusillimonas ginsengisoli]TEA79933.1 tripartite tricarboxylate transporter substrate binding protein [Allopusillimonas ginsengisoli]